MERMRIEARRGRGGVRFGVRRRGDVRFRWHECGELIRSRPLRALRHLLGHEIRLLGKCTRLRSWLIVWELKRAEDGGKGRIGEREDGDQREREGHTHKNNIKSFRSPLKSLKCQKSVCGFLKIPFIFLHIRREEHHIDWIIL